tara:strand:- start:1171 stop:1623 length:453 start_codon:yes stop_codon:yes gene_type:complete
MKTVFDNQILHQLINRANNLNDDAVAQWGIMNVHQMVEHCILTEKLFLGELKLKRVFIGRFIGRKALIDLLKDDTPLMKNAPTDQVLKTFRNGNIETLKPEWINLLNQYKIRDSLNFENFIHPFFGKMTKKQLGEFVYKHIDHHLRQFGV